MPDARRAELAAKLRHLRIQRGWTTRQLAGRTGISQTKIMRLETAKVAAKPNDVHHILRALDVRREIVDSLAQEAADLRSSRKSEAGLQLAGDYVSFVDIPQGHLLLQQLLHDTNRHRTLSTRFLPLGSQTVAYMRAVNRLAQERLQMNERAFIEAKMRLQTTDFATARRLAVVIDEAVLLRPMTSLSEWHHQLTTLRSWMRSTESTVAILPVGAPVPPVSDSTISYGDDVVEFESHSWNGLRSDEQVLKRHNHGFDELLASCEHGSDAEKVVDEAIKRLESIDLREKIS